MNKSTATSLLRKISVNDKVLNISSLSGGRQHLLYKIELENNKKFVIKELNFKCYLGNYSLLHFNLTETFATYVSSNLTNSLTAFKIGESFTITNNGKSYLIFPWCKGLNNYEINNNHCQAIAKLLVHIHTLKPIKLDLKPIPLENFQTNNWQDKLNCFLEVVEIKKLINLAIKCQKIRIACNETRSLSHRDINLENILWLSDCDAILIDWESAGFIVPVVELLGVATNLGGIASGKLDLTLVKSTIDTYKYNLNSNKLKMTQDLYIQSYASWFHWLDYCLSDYSNELDQKREIEVTLQAIKLLEYNKGKIINDF